MFTLKKFKSVLAILLLLAVAFAAMSCGAKPSEETFRGSYDKALEGVLESVDKYYGKIEQYDFNNLGIDMTMGITLSDGFVSELGNIIPIDLSFLNNLKMSMSENIKGDKISVNYGLIYGETELIDASIIADLAANAVFVGIPVLNETFVQYGGDEGVDFSIFSGSDISSVLPEKDSVKNLIKGVYNVVMDNIGEVTFAETELTANGVTQKCVEYTVELSEKELADIMVKFLKLLETDEYLKDIVITLANYSNFQISANADSELYVDPDEAYEEVVGYIREGIATFENEEDLSDETTLIWKSYITDNQDIIGIKLEAIDLENGESAGFYLGTARDKKDMGFELYTTELGEKVLVINGKAALDGKIASGSFEIKSEGEEVTVISFENVDAAKLMDGTFSGTFTVSLSEASFNLGETNLEIDEPSLKIDVVSPDEKHAEIAFGLYDGDELLTSITCEYNVSEAKDITVPEKVTTDMETWSAGINLNKLMENATNSGFTAHLAAILSVLLTYAS